MRIRSSLSHLSLVVLSVGACVLAACTGEPARTGPRVLTMVMAEDWASAPTVRGVIDDFEAANEGLRVEVTDAPFSQIPGLVSNASDLGQPFDLAHWHAFAAGAAGIAQPLDDLWEWSELAVDDYVPGAVDGVTWEGVRYGVPLDVNALVLLADGDALDAAGLSAQDLALADGFADAARQLAEDGGSQFGITVTASSWSAFGWIRAFGGDLVRTGEDGEVSFGFDDARTIAALDMLAQLVAEETAPSPFAPDLALDTVQRLTDGTVALHASGSWDLPITRRAADPGIEVDSLEVLPMPGGSGDTGTVLGGSSLFVPTGADDRELAFELMLALTADDVALELVDTEGRLPAVTRLYDGPPFTEDDGYRKFAAELERADVMTLLAFPQLEVAFGDALEAILRRELTAAEALGEVQRFAENGGADVAEAATRTADGGS